MMPPEREDLQRRLEAFHQFLSNLSAKGEEAEQQEAQRQRQLDAIQQYVSNLRAKPKELPAPQRPPNDPRRVSWRRVLLASALVAAVLLSGTVIARTVRPGAPACATSSVTPTAVVVGDSTSTVTAPAGPNIAFPLVTARLLGWQAKVDAHPNTGFSTPNGRDAQHPSFAATVGCVVAAHPRIVIVALGSDDAQLANPTGMVQSRATDGLADLHRRLSRTRIVVVGPLPPGSTPSPALRAVRDAVRAAAQAAHVEFIDPIAEGWITGERTDPGSGNANRMISTDARHLTPAGHAHVGLRLATDLSRLGLTSR
jgi:acyl-CoA thioesterase-1